MKKIQLIFLSLVFTLSLVAQSINFKNKPWHELKSMANTENKFLFVDCYTDWCGWCKVMDKKTFSDPEVIKFMNDKFISTQIDMEKGQGIDLAMKYRVTGFPSYLIFSPEGKLVYRTIGYQKVPDFMANLQNAITPEKQQQFLGVSNVVDLDFPDFYRNAFAGNGKRSRPDSGVVEAFFDNHQTWTDEIAFSVLSKFDAPEKVKEYFLSNIELYRQLYSIEVEDLVSGLIYRKMSEAIKNKDKEKANEVYAMVDNYMKEGKSEFKQSLLLQYLSQTYDWSNFTREFQHILNKEGYENTSMINNYSWEIYKKCEDQNAILKASVWMKKVIETDPQYMHLDTYAALLYKSKNYKEAKIYAKKAIKTGKKSKEDVKETKELLEKIIKAMKHKPAIYQK